MLRQMFFSLIFSIIFFILGLIYLFVIYFRTPNFKSLMFGVSFFMLFLAISNIFIGNFTWGRFIQLVNKLASWNERTLLQDVTKFKLFSGKEPPSNIEELIKNLEKAINLLKKFSVPGLERFLAIPLPSVVVILGIVLLFYSEMMRLIGIPTLSIFIFYLAIRRLADTVLETYGLVLQRAKELVSEGER